MFVDRFMKGGARSTGALNTVFTAVIAVALVDGALALSGEAVTRADTFTTGALRGVVKDKVTGDVTVGATVVATSPALQGEQIVITDETGGYYRRRPARPGTACSQRRTPTRAPGATIQACSRPRPTSSIRTSRHNTTFQI